MIFTQGSSVDTAGLQTVSYTAVKAGREYIYAYSFPAFAISLLPEDLIKGSINTWFNLKKHMAELGLGSEPVAEIRGIRLDTKAGTALVRVYVKSVPELPAEVQEAGFNPYAVVALLSALFAIIGVGITLNYVYDLTGGSTGDTPEECKGFFGSIRCAVRNVSLIATGAGLGVLLTLLVLLFLLGREKVT